MYVCESADAQEAARCLFEHFGRFGAPSQILSDRGSHFVNHVIMEFLSYVGTKHCISIAYSKQENSLVERTNKEINRRTTIGETPNQSFIEYLILHTQNERKLVLQTCYSAESLT